MQTNHDKSEGCLFISMTDEEASIIYDAIVYLLEGRNENEEVPTVHSDALTDILSALNLE